MIHGGGGGGGGGGKRVVVVVVVVVVVMAKGCGYLEKLVAAGDGLRAGRPVCGGDKAPVAVDPRELCAPSAPGNTPQKRKHEKHWRDAVYIRLLR